MTDFTGTWSAEEVASFLREQAIPVRVATRRPDGTLWPVALWYRYRDGCIECATQANAAVVGFLRERDDVGFDVSTNEIPYRGVRGNGTATVSDEDGTAVLRDLVERYLGGTDSDLAEWLLADDREEVCIRIDPARIYSWDFSDRM